MLTSSRRCRLSRIAFHVCTHYCSDYDLYDTRSGTAFQSAYVGRVVHFTRRPLANCQPAPEQGQRIAALRSRYQVQFELRMSAATSVINHEYLDILDRAWAECTLIRPAGGRADPPQPATGGSLRHARSRPEPRRFWRSASEFDTVPVLCTAIGLERICRDGGALSGQRSSPAILSCWRRRPPGSRAAGQRHRLAIFVLINNLLYHRCRLVNFYLVRFWSPRRSGVNGHNPQSRFLRSRWLAFRFNLSCWHA
jgi:hypothetical protein